LYLNYTVAVWEPTKADSYQYLPFGNPAIVRLQRTHGRHLPRMAFAVRHKYSTVCRKGHYSLFSNPPIGYNVPIG